MFDADAELLSILQYVLLIEIKSSTPAHGAMFVLNTYIEIKKTRHDGFASSLVLVRTYLLTTNPGLAVAYIIRTAKYACMQILKSEYRR